MNLVTPHTACAVPELHIVVSFRLPTSRYDSCFTVGVGLDHLRRHLIARMGAYLRRM